MAEKYNTIRDKLIGMENGINDKRNHAIVEVLETIRFKSLVQAKIYWNDRREKQKQNSQPC